MNIAQLRQMSANTALKLLGEQVLVTFDGGLNCLNAVVQQESSTALKEGAIVNTYSLWFAFLNCDLKSISTPKRGDVVTYDNADYIVQEIQATLSGITRVRVHQVECPSHGVIHHRGVAF